MSLISLCAEEVENRASASQLPQFALSAHRGSKGPAGIFASSQRRRCCLPLNSLYPALIHDKGGPPQDPRFPARRRFSPLSAASCPFQNLVPSEFLFPARRVFAPPRAATPLSERRRAGVRFDRLGRTGGSPPTWARPATVRRRSPIRRRRPSGSQPVSGPTAESARPSTVRRRREPGSRRLNGGRARPHRAHITA